MAVRIPRGWRSGRAHLVWNEPGFEAPETLSVRVPAIGADGALPRAYAGAGVGGNRAPGIEWSGVPDGARALWLVVQDPDVPLPRPIVHLSALLPAAPDGALPDGALAESTTAEGVRLLTAWPGRRGWNGPRPVPGHGPHAYVFQLFALDVEPGPVAPAGGGAALAAFRGHVLARGTVEGTYERP